MQNPHIATLRAIVKSSASWVLFEGGTVVFLPSADSRTDLSSAAQELLREHGPIRVGSPGGDFNPFPLDGDLGWAVSFDHPDILTLVAPDQIEPGSNNLQIGLQGRAMRGGDAANLRVVHVEDKRAATP